MTYNPEEIASYEILRFGTVDNCWKAYISGEKIDIGAIELIFGRYAGYAFRYSVRTGGRFELGEPVISQHPEYACNYARHILNDRFKMGEPIIATSPEYSYQYAYYVLRDRFVPGEKTILQSSEHIYWYCVNVLNGEWIEAEKSIVNNPKYYKRYYARYLADKVEFGDYRS